MKVFIFFICGFLLGISLVKIPTGFVHAIDYLFGTDGNNNFIIKGAVLAGTPTPTPVLILSSAGAITNAQINASQISSGTFGSNTGGGNYVFSGSVGIGTTAPAQTLSVVGTVESTSGGFKFPDGTTMTSKASSCTGAPNSSACLKATGTGSGSTGTGSIYFLDSSGNVRGRFYAAVASGYGTFFMGAVDTANADVAEYYSVKDRTIEAGDVVSLAAQDQEGVLGKTNKPYDEKLIGVISQDPGLLLGSLDKKADDIEKRKLALAGRVKVKIDPDSPDINIGDFLTSSTRTGLAMKATSAGLTIGKALESWRENNGKDRIGVLVNVSWYDGEKNF